MDSYDKEKQKIRPVIAHLVMGDRMTSDEQFQNATLRPILKMQHEVILAMVMEYIKVKKNTFFNLRKELRSPYIKNDLLGDRMILHELRGMIIGQFTKEEIEYYIADKSSINKRMQALITERIRSSLISSKDN